MTTMTIPDRQPGGDPTGRASGSWRPTRWFGLGQWGDPRSAMRTTKPGLLLELPLPPRLQENRNEECED